MARPIMRALVAEDNVGLCSAIARLALQWADHVSTAHTVKEALDLLQPPPELLIVDVRFPDGSALDIVTAARKLVPIPAIVAVSGQASPEEAFDLARAGVRSYVKKPITKEALTREVDRALESLPDIEPFVAASVGHRPLKEVQSHVRKVMVDQALALAHGNRTQTAKTLGLSRQAVQQILNERERDDKEPTN